jgi:hypothetical protein
MQTAGQSLQWPAQDPAKPTPRNTDTEYPSLADLCCQADQSEMIVLMSLIFNPLWRNFAFTGGLDRPTVPEAQAQRAALLAATPQTHPLAPIHAPTPQLIL